MEKIEGLTELDLDMLICLLRKAYSSENWKSVIEWADTLYNATMNRYEQQQLHNKTEDQKAVNNLKKPLVYYYGYSFLLKGIALKEQGDYDRARECISQYANLSWFEGLDEKGHEEVKYYYFIAQMNMYETNLLSGRSHVLSDFVQFLQENPTEILPGLVTVTHAANLYQLNIDHILDLFKVQINQFKNYEDDVNVAYYHKFLYQLSAYQIKDGAFEKAIVLSLKLLHSAIRRESEHYFQKAVLLFGFLERYASNEQKESFFASLANTLKERIVQ